MNAPHPLDCPHILYTPPGAMSGTLGDSDVIAHDGKLHLFHLVLPNHGMIAHAISEDGFHWEASEPALHTGANGCFDDDMLWTMQVVRHPNRALFLMYYTGCSRREHGQVQRIGLATSQDLIHWTRHSPGPILEAADPHYNADLGRVGFVSFRDPFVFWDDVGDWHMLFTARTPTGNRFASGCIGHATSKDGFGWQLQAPLFAPGEYEDLEVPSIVRGPGGWALFFNDFTRATTFCRVASTLAGPWRRPEKSQLLPSGQFVWRFCQWGGRSLLWNTLRAQANWPMRYCPPGSSISLLAPGKELIWNERDEPELQSWRHWETLAGEEGDAWTPAVDSVGWSNFGESLEFASPNRSVVLGSQTYEHFLLEGILDASKAARVGVIFRADNAGEEYLSIELDARQQRVELHAFQILPLSVPRRKLKTPTLLQTSAYAPSLDGPATFRLIVCGEYLEFSLNDRVLLAHASYARRSGKLGLFATEGKARFQKLRIRRLTPPWQEPVYP